MPSLYIVATPLGNLGDISERAKATLAAVDLIAAEDTRHSQRLLDVFGIRTRLFAVHQHNEQEAAGKIIEWLATGKHVALVTDAGTPAISDPGARLVRRVRAAGFRVVPVVGASAVIAALSVAGVVDGGFRFVGFLSAKAIGRRASLAELATERDAMVFYEAPHRVRECLSDMAAAFGGEREVLIAREMTKLHEEIVLLRFAEVEAWFAANNNRERGEFVIVVQGLAEGEGVDAETQRVLALLLAELPLKTAVRLAVEITGASRNAVYAHALEARQ